MKILLINSTYNIGSTGKILFDLNECYTKKGHDVYIAYGRYSSVANNNHIIKCAYELESKICHLISLITGNIYGYMFFSTLRLIKIIKKIKPTVVHLHCLNGYFVNIYKLLVFLKRNHIQTILTNHADFMYTANCGLALDCDNWIDKECAGCKEIKNFNGAFSLNRTHKFYIRMKKSFDNFDTIKITNVSPWLTQRSKQSHFFKDKANVSILNPIGNCSTKFIENPYLKYKLSNSTKIILFVTASFDNVLKGGHFIPKIAMLMQHDNVHFFVQSALKPKRIIDAPNITFLSCEANKKELEALYYFANVSIILSLRETFSMIVAESLSQGTPVVGFCAGGPESICLPEYCMFSKYGDLQAIIQNIKTIFAKNFDKNSIASAAKEKYGVEKICNEYLNLYASFDQTHQTK